MVEIDHSLPIGRVEESLVKRGEAWKGQHLADEQVGFLGCLASATLSWTILSILSILEHPI